MKTLLAVIVILAIGFGGWFFYQKSGSTSGGETSYAYSCANAMQFTLSPADDYSWLAIFPGEKATFPQQTLSYRDNVYGMRYMGTSAEITSTDNGVILGLPSGTTTCAVAEGSKSIPWDVDTTTIEQNLALVVSDSIIGTWRGTGETKFYREFKSDGTYADTRAGKEISHGLWFAFTDKNAPQVSFPIEKNNVYFQLADENGAVAYLKIATMSLSDLVLVYLDRPGILTFSLDQ